MKQVVFYHNDLDGVMCAAGYLIGTGTSAVLRPARSKYRQSLVAERPEGFDRVVVLDFAYSKHADLWIDHHRYEKFKWNDGVEVHFNPHAKSAFEIVSQIYNVGEEYVGDVNLHDSAAYTDFDYVFCSLDPSNVLRTYIEQCTSDSQINMLVLSLVNNKLNMAQSIVDLEIDGGAILKADRDKVDARLSEGFSMVNGVGVLFVEENAPIPRYAEYYRNPEMQYCIKYTESGGRLTIRLSRNPLIESNLSMTEVLIGAGVGNAGGHASISGGSIRSMEEPEITTNIIVGLGV